MVHRWLHLTQGSLEFNVHESPVTQRSSQEILKKESQIELIKTSERLQMVTKT